MIVILCLCSCAGPHTPFGSLDLWAPKKIKETKIKKASEESSSKGVDYFISFHPSRQVLHEKFDLNLKVESFRGSLKLKQLRFFYNKVDITKAFLKNAQISQLGSNDISISFKDLKLFEDGGQEFYVAVLSDRGRIQRVAHLLGPRCEFFEQNRVGNVDPFVVDRLLLSEIEMKSLKGGLNPSMVTALIAQESGFNPRAVSWAKAIGLTQITPLADKSLAKSTSLWPRHDLIDHYPGPLLKGLISSGFIRKSEDWRLNPKYSVDGGILFLNYIKDYWEKPRHQALLTSLSPDDPDLFSAVVLASYNSGPARVKKALEGMGVAWLDSEKLKAARKYVAKVSSLCQNFAK